MKTMTCPRCWGMKKDPDQQMQPCNYCSGDGFCADMQLSTNYSLSEFLKSDTAVRQRIANEPTAVIVAHLGVLVKELIQPVREKAGAPIRISSGYRSPKLNAAVKSKPTSAHLVGWAGDLEPTNHSRKELVDLIISEKLPFDQVIFEGTWVHVGRYRPGTTTARQEVLMTFDGGITFEKYNPDDQRLHNFV